MNHLSVIIPVVESNQGNCISKATGRVKEGVKYRKENQAKAVGRIAHLKARRSFTGYDTRVQFPDGLHGLPPPKRRKGGTKLTWEKQLVRDKNNDRFHRLKNR